jgi:PhnB protein
MELEPYLFFEGNCEEALAFYGNVFGGEVASLHRYEGSPMEGEIPPELKTKVMHASFVAGSLKFMAADIMAGLHTGDGHVSLSLAASDAAAGERVFGELSQGGNVRMPWGDVFWGGKFGMVTDKFGIAWMVSAH